MGLLDGSVWLSCGWSPPHLPWRGPLAAGLGTETLLLVQLFVTHLFSYS